MNPNNIAQIILSFVTNQNLVTRIIVIVVLSVYALFALVLNRQIGLLSGMFNQISFSPIFKGISILHVVAAIALLLYATFLI